MRRSSKILLTTAAVGAALAPAASADTLLTEAPGARNLAGGGGYLAWSSPTPEGQWKLTVRAPDGTVSQPGVAAFSQPTQPAIGTTAISGTARRLVAVYTRDGDVYELDLATGTERRNDRLSHRAEETAVAVSLGTYVVARKGRGLFVHTRNNSVRRLTTTVPQQVALAQSRVATIEGTGSARKVVIRRLSGRGKPMVAGRGLVAPNSLWLTRYRAGWATSNPQVGSRLYATRRFAGSGGPYRLSVIRDENWKSTSTLHGIVAGRGLPATYLDDEGVKTFSPVPFHGR